MRGYKEIRDGVTTPEGAARACEFHPGRLVSGPAVLWQLLRRERRILRTRRRLRRCVPPPAAARQADSGTSRTALPVPRRDDQEVSARVRQASAARVDDRAPERRPSDVARAD